MDANQEKIIDFWYLVDQFLINIRESDNPKIKSFSVIFNELEGLIEFHIIFKQ